MKKHSSWQRNQVGPDTLYGCLEYKSQPNNDTEADRLDIDDLAMTATITKNGYSVFHGEGLGDKKPAAFKRKRKLKLQQQQQFSNDLFCGAQLATHGENGRRQSFGRWQSKLYHLESDLFRDNNDTLAWGARSCVAKLLKHYGLCW